MASRRQMLRWQNIAWSAVPAVLLGGAIAIGGHPGSGAVCAGVVVGYRVVISFGRGEGWTLLRNEGDERQKQIVADSAQVIVGVVALVALLGTAWELAHGYYGPFFGLALLVGCLTIVVPQIVRRWS